MQHVKNKFSLELGQKKHILLVVWTPINWLRLEPCMRRMVSLWQNSGERGTTDL